MDLGITYGWPESHGVRDSKYGGDQLSSGNLMKRGSSSCGRDLGEDAPDYNMPLHIAALFIILAVSSLACAFPVFAVRFPRLRIPSWFLFLARHFGTGVLVATAFVHLLPTAFESLTDPCLSFFWNKKYPPMPGAISMAAIFLVIVIEQVFSRGHHGCSGAGLEQLNKSYAEGDRSSGEANKQGIVAGNPVLTCSGSNSSIENQNEGLAPLTEEQKHKKALLQCLLLEMGILFHSIFIGMTISVSVGSDFVVLLIAIAFHQAFEGLALGSRIAALNWEKKAIQPWLMSLAYGCTTPLGQAIGLILHKSYDPQSEKGLLVVGIINAISSGLLIFASLVELVAEDFLSDGSWKTLRGKRRVGACIVVFLGAFGMSVIGAWA